MADVDGLEQVCKRFSGLSDVVVLPGEGWQSEYFLRLAMAHLHECGYPVSRQSEAGMADFYQQLVDSETAVVLFARRRSSMIGMVVAGLVAPDPWANEVTMSVSMLYVRPEVRRMPAVVMSLMRGCLDQAKRWNAKVVRIMADKGNERLQTAYSRLFGFKADFQTVTYSLRLEESE